MNFRVAFEMRVTIRPVICRLAKMDTQIDSRILFRNKNCYEKILFYIFDLLLYVRNRYFFFLLYYNEFQFVIFKIS